MLELPVRSKDPGDPPDKPRGNPIGDDWQTQVRYFMWYKSVDFKAHKGSVSLVVQGSHKPISQSNTSSLVFTDFDIVDAKRLRDRLTEAINEAESKGAGI